MFKETSVDKGDYAHLRVLRAREGKMEAERMVAQKQSIKILTNKK